jgi:hypothetical protein
LYIAVNDVNGNNSIADNVSSDLYFLRKRLRELAIHFKPSISENELDLFVSKSMNMIDNELEKLVDI